MVVVSNIPRSAPSKMNKRQLEMSVTGQPQSSSNASPPIKKYKIERSVNCDESMYLDATSADVHFSFGSVDKNPPTTRVPAHKHLLAAGGDVFKRMFYGPLKEDGDIRVTDTSDAAFKEFLKFFYLSEVELRAESIADIMYLGQKYDATKCIEACVQFLKDAATADNILIALDIAILYAHSELMKFCHRFIVLNTNSVLESSGFLGCEQKVLEHILKENLLAVSDVKVFEACMEWVKAKSEQNALTKAIVDTHLGDLFYEIRFGSMTIQEFCKLATKYDSVLSNDINTIIKLIAFPDYKPEKFNIRPREIKWNGLGTKIDSKMMNMNMTVSRKI